MAISLVGEIHVPAAENGSNTGTTITIDKDAAAWSTLASGDKVFVSVYQRNSATWSVTTSGGQTWSEVFDTTDATRGAWALYTCIFNGTWTADPVFTATGSSTNISGWAFALSGVDDAIWETGLTPSPTNDTTPYDFATVDTLVDGSWAIVFVAEPDDNTHTIDNSFGTLSGAATIYWRNPGGADGVLVISKKVIATAGAVGATTSTASASDTGFKAGIGVIIPTALAGGDAMTMTVITGGF